MQNTRSRIQYLPMTILIVLGVLVWAYAAAADMYSDSAHGNADPEPAYGVHRSGIDHPIGDCAHCHETDGSVCDDFHFMLFYDDLAAYQTFCTTCHGPSSTWQPIVNYPYARNFGGASQTWYPNIYTQFADNHSLPAECGSRHHLGQIRTGLLSQVGQDWGFNDDPNPCVACHAPHAGRRNYPVSDVRGGGALNTAIRRPSHYKSTNPQDFLWGDDDNRPGEPERMDEYAASVGGYYQAPYYGSFGSGQYEPAADATSDGSNLPNYVTFCMDCHQYEQSDPDRGGATVKAIDWLTDIHGAAPANTLDAADFVEYCMIPAESALKAPYVDFESSNYVLSCLDCHEPHGTYKRLHLLRLVINGEAVGVDTNPSCANPVGSDWYNICEKCHAVNHGSEGENCQGCHGTSDGFHGTVFECAFRFGDCDWNNLDACPRSF
jgi:cytochrome c553